MKKKPSDISRKKENLANKGLANSPEWLEAIFEGSRDAIFVSDINSRFVVVNQAASDLTGYPKKDLLKMKIPDLHETMELKAYELFHQKILSGTEVLTEAKILRKNGKKIYTDQDKLEFLIRKNPELGEMKSRFTLDFDQ